MAQSVTYGPVALPAGSQFVSPTLPIGQADRDCRITFLPDLVDFQDPRVRVSMALERSGDNGATWEYHGGGDVRGSALHTASTPLPWVEVAAPPDGYRIRARVQNEGRTVTLRARVDVVEGVRRIKTPPPHNSVAYDNSVETNGGTVTSLTTPSFTIAGTSRYLVIGVGDRGQGTISAGSCAGGTPSSIIEATNDRRAALWGLLAPSTGSQTCTMNWSNTDNGQMVLMAISFTGVDQTTPTANSNSATGTSNAPSVTISGAVAGGMIVDCCTHANLDGAVGANQTERVREVALSGMSTQDGADGGVMSWASTESLVWATTGVRLVEAGPASRQIIIGPKP